MWYISLSVFAHSVWLCIICTFVRLFLSPRPPHLHILLVSGMCWQTKILLYLVCTMCTKGIIHTVYEEWRRKEGRMWVCCVFFPLFRISSFHVGQGLSNIDLVWSWKPNMIPHDPHIHLQSKPTGVYYLIICLSQVFFWRDFYPLSCYVSKVDFHFHFYRCEYNGCRPSKTMATKWISDSDNLSFNHLLHNSNADIHLASSCYCCEMTTVNINSPQAMKLKDYVWIS